MDTTTVNYAIEKLNEAFLAIKPAAVELGSEYVGYMILRATIEPFFWLIAAFIALFLGRWAWSKHENYDDNWDLLGIIGYGAASFFAGAFINATYIAILANTYPLMYTIEQLAK